MLRVAAYTSGRTIPAVRFRIRQYVEHMSRFGVELHEFISHAGGYPPQAHWQRPAWLLAALTEHCLQVPGSHRFDAVVFQRELISTLVTLEPLFGKPRLLDVDDAIWLRPSGELHPRGTFAGRLASKCDAVICGNAYLADYFSKHCKRIFILPTAVDVSRFCPVSQADSSSAVIGWSGTSVNLPELKKIEPALHVVLERFGDVRLRVICNQRPQFNRLPADRVDYVHWSPEIEVSALQDLRVGLMPLTDNAWTRGKCAFKMLTYMACAVPVVVSPVGMNSDVLAMDDVGYGANHMDEWVEALSALLGDAKWSEQMGERGRAVAEQSFSIEALSPKLAGILKEVAG